MDSNQNIVLSDFLFPALVAVLASLFSYWGSYRLNKRSQAEEKRLKAIDFIDYLSIECNKLILVFEKLREDVAQYNFFLLTNISIGTTILQKLKAQSEKVILFQEDNLRRQIIEYVDIASSIVEEMELMERHPLNETFKLEQIKNERIKELRTINLQLLSLGIYLDKVDNYKPKHINTINSKKISKTTPKDVEAIENILQSLVFDINSSEANLKKLYADNEKRRSFLLIRILDIQTKLRELLSFLSILRNKISS